MARKIMTAHLALNRLCLIETSHRQVSEWDSLRLGPWPISVIDHLSHLKWAILRRRWTSKWQEFS